MSKTALYFIIMILISLGAFYYVSGEIKAFSKEIDTIASKQQYYNPKIFKEKVVIATPLSHQIITNPVTIKGSVSGTWFFEGQIMSKVVDAEGVVLGQGPLVATDDWTTVKSVGFSGVIPFTKAGTKDGFIVISADNPREEGDTPSFQIPIQFGTTDPTACSGDSCGECTIGALGTNGVCVHGGGIKVL
ncbi:MAG: Gmad2 immunoglobulin-like domain-containing protein [Patescibacteria group bacterium]